MFSSTEAYAIKLYQHNSEIGTQDDATFDTAVSWLILHENNASTTHQLRS